MLRVEKLHVIHSRGKLDIQLYRKYRATDYYLLILVFVRETSILEIFTISTIQNVNNSCYSSCVLILEWKFISLILLSFDCPCIPWKTKHNFDRSYLTILKIIRSTFAKKEFLCIEFLIILSHPKISTRRENLGRVRSYYFQRLDKLGY